MKEVFYIIGLIKLMDTNGSMLATEQLDGDNNQRKTITGQIELDSIEINITLSIAPSFNSMLCRGGIVGVTIEVKVNGTTAIFACELTAKEKTEVGQVLSGIERAKDQALKDSAVERLNLIFKS